MTLLSYILANIIKYVDTSDNRDILRLLFIQENDIIPWFEQLYEVKKLFFLNFSQKNLITWNYIYNKKSN